MLPRPALLPIWSHYTTAHNIEQAHRMIDAPISPSAEQRTPNIGSLKLSYALNLAGIPITQGKWHIIKDENGKSYIPYVKDLLYFLTDSFGVADHVIKHPTPSELTGISGILVLQNNWDGDAGTVSLWNGAISADPTYVPLAAKVSIWALK